MARVIAIANIKGGVGKTTTTGNLGAALAERGRCVLAVDLDPQASLSISFGYKLSSSQKSIRDALAVNPAPLAGLVVTTAEHLDLVPANHDLRQTERQLEGERIRIMALKNALGSMRERYDYILLDCPANAGILTGNALAAADEVVVPFPADYLAMQTLDWFLQIVAEIKSKLNPSLRIAGLFLSMYEPRVRHAREIIAEVKSEFGIQAPFFSAAVRNTVAMKQAARNGQSILRFAPGSQAAEAYRLLAQEVEQGVRESTRDANAHIQSGRVALAAGDRAKAFASFRQATAHSPQLIDGWLGRADTAPDWEEGVKSYAQALALDPEHPRARAGLQALLERLPGMGAADVGILINAGHFLADCRQDSLAHLAFTRATNLAPGNSEAWRGRGRTTGDPQQAVEYLERARSADPTHREIQADLAIARERLKAAAATLVDEAQTLNHGGQTQQAHELFRQAVDMDPQNDRGWVGLARTTASMEEALVYADRALAINPTNAEARELHAWLGTPQAPAASGSRMALRLFSGLIAAVIIIILLLLLIEWLQIPVGSIIHF